VLNMCTFRISRCPEKSTTESGSIGIAEHQIVRLHVLAHSLNTLQWRRELFRHRRHSGLSPLWKFYLVAILLRLANLDALSFEIYATPSERKDLPRRLPVVAAVRNTV